MDHTSKDQSTSNYTELDLQEVKTFLLKYENAEYDLEEVIHPMMLHVHQHPEVTLLRLRPNGIDAWKPNGVDIQRIINNKKNYVHMVHWLIIRR